MSVSVCVQRGGSASLGCLPWLFHLHSFILLARPIGKCPEESVSLPCEFYKTWICLITYNMWNPVHPDLASSQSCLESFFFHNCGEIQITPTLQSQAFLRVQVRVLRRFRLSGIQTPESCSSGRIRTLPTNTSSLFSPCKTEACIQSVSIVTPVSSWRWYCILLSFHDWLFFSPRSRLAFVVAHVKCSLTRRVLIWLVQSPGFDPPIQCKKKKSVAALPYNHTVLEVKVED